MQSIATLGGGCFWCFETIFKEVAGIISAVSGYSGGTKENPTDQDIYYRNTGHAEVVQLTFDPNVISYKDILEIFFVMHDPTMLNQQDYDIGEEYRSIIFYHDAEQHTIAEEMKNKFATTLWDDPVMTHIVPFEKFWPAADYHQDFYAKNPYTGYCQIIINPKLQKFRQKYAARLKTSAA
ncbi:MAG TPA: peptide-methionine (S)-S-oxide reductase MsrA [Candidatus Limnocylindrales bacterium]|nr:peptide-methionine (S)-S-oxide reductase MsrA [Candidatus Limnocylindrales bacterium]